VIATYQVGKPQSVPLGDLPDIYSGPKEAALPPPGPTAMELPVSLPRVGMNGLFDSSFLGGAASQPAFAGKSPVSPQQHVAVTGYVDADSLGNRNVYADATYAPFGGIYESGLRFRATGDASWYRFITNDNPRTLGAGRYLEGDFLVGYGLWAPRFNVTGFVGPAFAQIDNLAVNTDRWGVKGSIEMSVKPTDWSTLSAAVSYSTATNELQVQAKAGWKILEVVNVGPEVKLQWKQILPAQVSFFTGSVATTTSVSPQTNIAYMHLGAFSAINVGRAVVSLSGGWAQDRQLGSGYYGSASVYLPF
jgi:Cellulose biosynthesis protein BcsS